MDYTRVTQPTPSILVHDHNGNHARRHSNNRSAGSPIIRTPGAMPIPNARHDPAPPPLPPPRHLDELSAGRDPGWEWGNNPSGVFGRAGRTPVAGSNFPKSWGRKGEERRRDEVLERPEYKRRDSSTSTITSPTEGDRRYDFDRRQDEGYYSLSTSRPSAMSQQSVKIPSTDLPDDPPNASAAMNGRLHMRMVRPTKAGIPLWHELVVQHFKRVFTIANPLYEIRLHGERQLQQRNIESSSQAYDNKLLSKIGKPKTPPRTSTLSSLQSSPSSSLPYHPHPDQSRSLSCSNSNSLYSNSAYSESPPIKREPSGYEDSPRSKPISPGLISSAMKARHPLDWRNPNAERSAPSSFDVGSDSYYPQRFPSSSNVSRQQKSRRSTSGSLLSSYDELAGNSLKNTASYIKRENYEQPMFSEQDSVDPTFPMRQLHLEDRPPLNNYSDPDPYYNSSSHHSLHTSRSRPGMKRKPSPSPPPDRSHDRSQAANAQLLAAAGMNADPFQRNTSQRVSPGSRFGQSQGSISSQSSLGARNNSYASSTGLSVGGSSMTSFDQHSPGTLSPSSEPQQHYQQHNGQDSPYVTSLAMNPSARNTRSQQQYPQGPLEDQDIDQKPQISPDQRRGNVPNMQSQALICQCCPKKPKKFDTPEQLRHHESEKQYQCQYCTNRFKNKNEAERHQNSLHLRKHSWSCATLNGQYDLAFYPSTTIPPAENNPAQPPTPVNQLAAFDTCGYCGEQFPNEPAPDWDERSRHLINTHKFGECNQSKKFFRADHFRQHLKHSHAGTSGKWTNMLENACMKDEPNPEPQDTNSNPVQSPGAPVANMGMGQANLGQVNMGQPPLGQASMGQAHMAQANMGQNVGQANMGQNMGQTQMGQAQLAQAAQMAQMDMSNIDPSIGLQPMSNMGPMGNMNNMGPPGRGIGMQGGQMRDEEISQDI